MLRKTLILGTYKYVIDVFDANIDNIVHYDQFVMFRSYNIIDDVVQDTDIYFVDKYIYDNDLLDGDITDIIWPVNYQNLNGFSYDYKKFNGFFDKRSITNKDGYNVVCKDDNDVKIANILCNKIKLYHPINMSNENLIVHIDNFINNIHVHYFCRMVKDLPHKAETIFKLNNTEYSEYVEFYYPNVYDLFNNNTIRSNNTKYRLDTFNEIGDIIGPDSALFEPYITDNGDIYIPLSIYSFPYEIMTNEETQDNQKRYVNVARSIENNYLTYPVNVTLFPYEDVDKDQDLSFIIDSNIDTIATTTCQLPLSFTLSASVGFVDNKISIVTKFQYPDVYKFISDESGSAVMHAYEYYNNVSKDLYDEIGEEVTTKLFKDIDAITELTDNDKILTIEYYKRNFDNNDPTIKELIHNNVSNEVMLEYYKKMRKKVISDEIEESSNTSFDFLGFRILIASDVNYKNLIFDNNVKISFKDLDDFAFNIDGIFKSWPEVHENLYTAKVMFIDRYLGTQIFSNDVILTDETLKFMVNSTNKRLSIFDNNDIVIDNIYDINEDMKYCFLDNINCSIKKIDDNNNINIINSNNSTKVLYKPIFYKTSDLQNIKIRANVKQNIGINLMEFLTKVETFKLLLGSYEFLEIGRNDGYVLFEINGSKLSGTLNGVYDILNQDDEYISSGNWTLIN